MFYFTSLWRDARTSKTPVLWLVLPLLAPSPTAPGTTCCSGSGDQLVPLGLVVNSWCLNVPFPDTSRFRQLLWAPCGMVGMVLGASLSVSLCSPCKARRVCCSPLHPSSTLCPSQKALIPPVCPSLLSCSYKGACGQAPFLAHSGVGSTRISSCFQIHTGFPGEINRCPLTTSFLQTQGAWPRWGLHF